MTRKHLERSLQDNDRVEQSSLETDIVDQSMEAQETQEFQQKVSETEEMKNEEAWLTQVYENEILTENNLTRIPNQTKQQVERKLGVDLSELRVYYTSNEPSTDNALITIKGNEIFLSANGEKYLIYSLLYKAQSLIDANSNHPYKGFSIDALAAKLGKKSLDQVSLKQEDLDDKCLFKNAKKEKIGNTLFQKHYPIFFSIPHEVIKPLSTIPDETNNHGYTVTETTNAWIEPSELLESIKPEDNVALFIKNGEIEHSARLVSGGMRHMLDYAGLIETYVSLEDKIGYDARFNLPEDRAALERYLAEHAKKKTPMVDEYQTIIEVTEILEYADKNGVDQLNLYEAWTDLDTNDAKITFWEQNKHQIEAIERLM